MAGDWIKMRGNLWDDPRVAKLADMTNSHEATIIGALYWLWATADQHTEDGIMPDLSTRSIDRKTGVAGFANALISIGWLTIEGDGVSLPEFEKHNGSSSKKRMQTAKRVAKFVAANASNTQPSPNTNAHSVSKSVSAALPREEKRREEIKTGGERERAQAPEAGPPSAASASPPPPIFSDEDRDFCKTERPDLDPTRTRASFCDHYPPEKQTQANWRKWVRREVLGPVAGVDLAPAAAVSDPDSKASVEALGLAVGFGRWDQLIEPWQAYKTRVKTAQFQPQKAQQCH